MPAATVLPATAPAASSSSSRNSERRSPTRERRLSGHGHGLVPSQRKTSLGYILAPVPLASPAAGALSPAAVRKPTDCTVEPGKQGADSRIHGRTYQDRKDSGLLRLPRSALSLIAYHLVLPTFASAADASAPPALAHPAALVPLIYTCRSTHSALAFAHNPQLYRDLYAATFDTPALRRRHAWISSVLRRQSGAARPAYNLFDDPKSWAEDYKARWEMRGRMRRVALARTFDLDTDREEGSGQGGENGAAGHSSNEQAGRGPDTAWPSTDAKEKILPDLWTAWFLVTENDGKNVPFLTEHCGFHEWLAVYYRERLLKEALEPGYPEETGEKALMIWCALLTGTDLIAEQSSAEVDEKIFMLRPYVFACAKYNITYAPWHHRRLPICAPGCTCTERASDTALRSKAIPYERFGFTWRRAPPHFVLGAYLVFLRLLERQQARLGADSGIERPHVSSTFSMPGGPNASPGSTRPTSPSMFSSTRIMPSIFHDREWQRNSVCQDPHTSLGLPPLTFAGELQGFWRGNFLFYDFEQYRGILSGDMRALYTTAFAAQAVEMELKETIVRVRVGEVGGAGSGMSAGYDVFDGNEDGPQGLRDDEENPEQRRIREGNGYQVVRADEEDPEGWTKEILLTGKARTSWGWARARGRVRAWDGLVVISFNYAQHQRHPLGRWLWRGYLHTGGYLIGRWRDTFTPEQLQGYEGAFGMVRAGDIFYPPNHPTRLADSLGLDDTAVKDNLASTVAAASRSGVTATMGQDGIEENECNGLAAASSASTLVQTSLAFAPKGSGHATALGDSNEVSATALMTAPERVAEYISAHFGEMYNGPLIDRTRPPVLSPPGRDRRPRDPVPAVTASRDEGDPRPRAETRWSGSGSGSSDGQSSVRIITPTSGQGDVRGSGEARGERLSDTQQDPQLAGDGELPYHGARKRSRAVEEDGPEADLARTHRVAR